MRLLYIDAMEHFWSVSMSRGGLSERDFFVFGYLVRLSNGLRGKNPFEAETKRIQLVLKLQPAQLARSQKRLEDAELIKWQRGAKGRFPTYEILTPRSAAVTNTVTDRGEKRGKSAESVTDTVTDTVTLQGIDKSIEGGRDLPPQDLIALAEKHTKWRRLEPDCLRQILQKFVDHYRTKPHMINASRWMDWLKDEHKKNLRWRARELPLVPGEPDGWERLRFAEYDADNPIQSMSWEEIWKNYPDMCNRWIAECDAKRD